jgi:hypothetical protein
MKRRIAIWASVGFVVACCWVLYTFMTPPERLLMALREPFVEFLGYASCPIAFAARRHFALHFWWISLINAATYAVIGLIAEILVAVTQLRPKNAGLAI